MHPCRYSFPGGTALNKYTLISTQHSLHLYQPVTLPCDYLTGEAAELKDAPIEKNWKKYLRLMPTSGLIGYSGDIQLTNSNSSRRVYRDNLPLVTLPQTPDTVTEIRRLSTRGNGSTFSSQEGVNISHSDDDSPNFPLDRPSAYMDPLIPAEMTDSMLSPSVAVREGREAFIRYGLTDMTLTVSSSQLMTDVSTQSTVNGTPVTPTADSKHIMISKGHRSSVRRIQNDGKSVTYRETACASNSHLNQGSFFSWFNSEQSPTMSESSSVTHSFSTFENLLRCNSDSVSEEELNQIVHEYRICRQREGGMAF